MASEHEPTLEEMLDALCDPYYADWEETKKEARAAIIDRDARIRAERDQSYLLHGQTHGLLKAVSSERDQAIADRDQYRTWGFGLKDERDQVIVQQDALRQSVEKAEAERDQAIAERDVLRVALVDVVDDFRNPYDGGEYEDGEMKSLDRARAALAALQSAAPDRRVPKLTEAMIRGACLGHYKTENIDGVSMTFKGRDYSFRQAFKRMWQGLLAAAPPPPAPVMSERVTDEMVEAAHGVSPFHYMDTSKWMKAQLEAAITVAPEHPAVAMLRKHQASATRQNGSGKFVSLYACCPECRLETGTGHDPDCALAKLITPESSHD